MGGNATNTVVDGIVKVQITMPISIELMAPINMPLNGQLLHEGSIVKALTFASFKLA